ncbi:MAG TPA: hypothetical protein VJ653_09090 [Acidimicrobiales bacterium]|nr:hypothetical protein [Acidimicrobiales bacterium]
MAEPDIPDPAEAALAAKKRTVLITAVGAVIAAALLFAVMTRITSTTSTPAGGAGGERAARFELGRATDYARTIARDGPLLLPDPQGRSRDIFIQHLGEKNWLAFEARATGAPRQCTLKWEASGRRFVDPCDGTAYPQDGAGLVSFPTTVDDDGVVVVDLSSPRPS